MPDDIEVANFLELRSFTESWNDLKLTDEDLFALQVQIMVGPKRAPLVAGTGGLRKMRFAPRRWKRGKRGSIRVGYVYFEEYAIVLLVLAYAKSDKGDLTPNEKKTIRALISRAGHEFSSGPSH
jgi:hypothetical protein